VSSGDSRNKKTISLSLLSGNGAALLLSIALPFQLVGRVPDDVAGYAFIAGAAGMAAFGYGAVASVNALELSETKNPRYRDYVTRAVQPLLIGGIVVMISFLALGIGLTAALESVSTENSSLDQIIERMKSDGGSDKSPETNLVTPSTPDPSPAQQDPGSTLP